MTDETIAPSAEGKLFAGRTLQLQRETDVTQVQLIGLSSVAQAHVSALEQGAWGPRFEMIIAIVHARKAQPSIMLPKINQNSAE